MLIIKSIIKFLAERALKVCESNDRKKTKQKAQQNHIRFFQQVIDDGNNLSLARFYNAKGERIRGKYEGLRKNKITNIDSNMHPLEVYYSKK
jgi:hypothetical protein